MSCAGSPSPIPGDPARPSTGVELSFQVALPADAALTQPYWLESPWVGDRFSVPNPKLLGSPFAPPLLDASLPWQIQEEGFPGVVVSQCVVGFPVAGRGFGDVREPIRVVPELSVSLEPSVLIAPLKNQALQKQVNVTVLGNMAGDVALRLEAPAGRTMEPVEHRITLAAAGQEATRRFAVQIPALATEGRFRIQAVGDFQRKRFSRGYRVIAYPHIRTHLRYRDAVARVEAFRVDTAPGLNVGKDFGGWIQERGLNFLDQWDERFTSLLESHDPGEPPRRGGMVIATYGKGTCVYTGYAWFRQLPAGVPGALRLFANLISHPRAQ